jgi:hypothetical protein
VLEAVKGISGPAYSTARHTSGGGHRGVLGAVKGISGTALSSSGRLFDRSMGYSIREQQSSIRLLHYALIT